MRHQRLHIAVLIVVVGCLTLMLSCGLGAVAVRQGVVVPPNLSLQVGSVRVAGIVSYMPDCTRLLAPGCTPLNRIPTTYIYTLWLYIQSEPNTWEHPTIKQLVRVQLGH